MIVKTTIAAALISVSTLAAVPANAGGVTIDFGYDRPGWSDQGYRHGDGRHMRNYRLSSEEVRWMLRDRGYHGIRILEERGAVYQVHARKHGARFILFVSARSGDVLARTRI